MIKKLTENPDYKKIYKTKDFQGNTVKGFLMKEYGGGTDVIVVKSWDGEIRELPLNDFMRNREWEEVKEPVDFTEAVKSGKRIKVEHSCLDGILDYLTTRYNELGDVLDQISTYLSDGDIRKVLLNGKWYIED